MIKAVSEPEKFQPDPEEKPSSLLQSVPAAYKPHFGEKLARNLALAGMVLITVVAVRNAELPSGQTVLAAVQEMIDPNWDENIGKISFVSSLFPETVAVFFESEMDVQLTAPCFGALIHAWSSAEPYLSYASADRKVYAVADGQVMSIAHGMEEEHILRVRQEDGLETLYYNLASAAVREGDLVTASTCLGETMADHEAMVEVRRSGRAIDPTAFLIDRATP